MIIRKTSALLAGMTLISLSGCVAAPVDTTFTTTEPVINSYEIVETSLSAPESTTTQTETATVPEKVKTMVLKINGTEVPVIWENNDSVEDLMTFAENGLSIEMSMYGGFEQVGPIGQSITSNDEQTTTSSGDIVLYSGDQIVIFYGTNTWAYTRLGKVDLSEEELTELLSNGDVTITLTVSHS